MDEQAGGLGLSSIQEINHLPREMAEALYLRLVPEELLERFRIDPRTLTGPEGTRLVQITAPEDKPWARVEVRSSDGFCRLIGAELYLIEPLFYHSAVLYERHGCGYLLGRAVMDSLHAEFSEGGGLATGLDGSTPFRVPEAGRTVRGRSWALHDGISRGAWSGVKMYKAVGLRADINTFPGGIY